MRAFLSAGLVVGLVAGCARTRGGAVADNERPSLTTITSEDIERSPGVSLEQLIVARIPGITLGRAPDGHLTLQIRGTATFQGVTEPLVVLDGIPLEPNPSGNLHAVDPHDIATIEVLRDGASTARYGARGAGGVILIKTKRPPPQ